MNELTPAQTAVITAIWDYDGKNDPVAAQIAHHAAVKALTDGLDWPACVAFVNDTIATMPQMVMAGRAPGRTPSVRLSALGNDTARAMKIKLTPSAPKAEKPAPTPAPVAVDAKLRFISTVKAAPAVGSVFSLGNGYAVCIAHSKRSWTVTDQSAIVIEQDRFDLVGEECTYVYYRPTTPDDTLPETPATEPAAPAVETPVTPAEITAAIQAAPAVDAPENAATSPLAHWAGLSGSGWTNLTRTADLIRMTQYNPSTPELPARVKWVRVADLPERVRAVLPPLPTPEPTPPTDAQPVPAVEAAPAPTPDAPTLTDEQRHQLFMHDVNFTVVDVFTDVARWRDELLFPMQRRIRDCDPHTEVYSDNVKQELAAAWGRWVETRHRILTGRRNRGYGEVLDSGYALTTDAPREVTPLDAAWVEHQATHVRREPLERARIRLSRERMGAIQEQAADLKRKLALLEGRDYWLTDPFSVQIRLMLDWYTWAAVAYRGAQ